MFDVLVPRFSGVEEAYTKVYKIPPNEKDKSNMGIVEFLQNNLPPLEPSEDELVKLKTEYLMEKFKVKVSPRGVLV